MENNTEITDIGSERLQGMMDSMDANLDSQDEPKVGIFWYSPRINDVFGVVAVDAKERAKIENRAEVSCKELHKYVWKKNYNYYKNHGGNILYQGDYKYTPRGRVFYYPETDEYVIAVGDWIDDHHDAIRKIKEAFDLTDPSLNVKVQKGIHWQIGMGYGD